MSEQQNPIDNEEHACNDIGPVDWQAYHANSETLKMPNRSKKNEQEIYKKAV